ncbi:hypothetical protein BUALT_Bualt04G0095700 [Buddleja alternifolia]|uniref:Uncharacterized protein n=1 Tax=Buddleja alternifolia TaxID=168488 RepID=A0AAV6XMN3_9LAMI|nr:hypothetical protein BUALT_Bualt04G0095700 [Buddleja alternifolia]
MKPPVILASQLVAKHGALWRAARHFEPRGLVHVHREAHLCPTINRKPFNCLCKKSTADQSNQTDVNKLLADESFMSSILASQRHEVPWNFKRVLSSRLRRLVLQDKLEKVKCKLMEKANDSEVTDEVKDQVF